MTFIHEGSIKPHMFPDFVGELSSPSNLEYKKVPVLSIDEAYNLRGVGVRVVKGPKNCLLSNVYVSSWIPTTTSMGMKPSSQGRSYL